MSREDRADDPRRRQLIQALSLGLFTAGLPWRAALAQVFGSTPSKLPPGQSIYRISGTALVNGTPATLKTPIGSNDTVETLKSSEIVFVVGENAMVLRGGSRIELRPDQNRSILLSGFRMLTGALLSVSRNRQMAFQTATATIGIRGTGFYLESDPQQTYFCTCYGASDIAANDDPTSKDSVVSAHHDKPLYILAKAQPGQSIRGAPFINHTDQELMLIETLAGRTPPWIFPGSSYNAPRRDY